MAGGGAAPGRGGRSWPRGRRARASWSSGGGCPASRTPPSTSKPATAIGAASPPGSGPTSSPPASSSTSDVSDPRDVSGPRPGHLDAAIASLRENTELSDERLARLFESAFVDTYRRLAGGDGPIHARVDLAAGTCSLYRTGPGGEETPLAGDIPDFPRQAAQAARDAVATALREAGKDRVLREASLRRGEMIDTIVDPRAGTVWYLRPGDMRVLLPPEEQAQGEELIPGHHLKVMVLEGRRRSQDAVGDAAHQLSAR